MRTLAFLRKTFLENLREWKILAVTIAFAPSFVYLMYAYFSTTAPAYRLLVVNRDVEPRSATPRPGAAGLLVAWRAAAHADGRPAFAVTELADEAEGVRRLREREAELLVVVPDGFSARLVEFHAGGAAATLTTHVDDGNARALMAIAFADYVAFTYAGSVTQSRSPLEPQVRRVGAGRTPSDFDLYVPALLVLALIMVMFTACASLIREVDKGTMTRLVLSRLRVGELLAAVSINQVLVGTAALALTLLAAASVGYRTTGSLAAVLVVGAVGTLGVVAMSALVASFLRSTFELLTVGCFPFFALMFFSESMMPLPKVAVAQLAGHTLYANDVLPTSLAVRAFGKILNHGAGLDAVVFELSVALVGTAVYFGVGAWLFARRHYRLR